MDTAFIKLYTDFQEALTTENPNVATIVGKGMIQQLPNETFQQKTNSTTDIVFAGGIKVELIKCDQTVAKDITSNFFYEPITDKNGIKQIDFEFGMIGDDFQMQPLHLKITDLVNDNVWYSNQFVVTYYKQELRLRVDYWSEKEVNGIAYDLFQYKQQSIGFSNFFENEPDDKTEFTQLTMYNGNTVNYRSIVTPQTIYKMDFCDTFVYRRLMQLRKNDLIYFNGKRVTIGDIKKDNRQGDSSWFGVTVTANVQEETYNWGFDLFEGLNLLLRYPTHQQAYIGGQVAEILGTFDRPITLTAGKTLKLYRDTTLVDTFSDGDISVSGNDFTISFATLTTNGTYRIVAEAGLFKNGILESEAIINNEWIFYIQNGDWDNSDFNGLDWLVN